MSEYGGWHRPAFGQMHTQRPTPTPRADPADWLAREGAGDYRRPAAMLSGKGEIRNVPSDHRTENNAARVYVSRRNGLPEDKPYRWGEPRRGWAARVARRNLDLAAIAAADAELDARGNRKS